MSSKEAEQQQSSSSSVMWRLCSAEEGQDVIPKIGKPLKTLCKLAGRQVWKYEIGKDAQGEAQGEGEAEAAEEAREEYKANRAKGVKHSADELLRIQCCGAGYKNVTRVDTSYARGPIGGESKSGLEGNEEGSGSTSSEEDVNACLLGGLEFYQQLQQEDGHWPGDYGGPMFLMPGLIITCYVTGQMESILPKEHRKEMIRYLMNHQNDDGGYGLHIEGHSTMFGTVLSYVSLRLLGAEADDARCQKARKWILIHGGATLIPSWGKFWLSVLGVFSWDGLNPTPPEMWLLPYTGYSGVGYMHPGRFWCHCRMVYLPMSYIYGARIVGKVTPLVEALREEIHLKSYALIDWNKARNEVSFIKNLSKIHPHTFLRYFCCFFLFFSPSLLPLPFDPFTNPFFCLSNSNNAKVRKGGLVLPPSPGSGCFVVDVV